MRDSKSDITITGITITSPTIVLMILILPILPSQVICGPSSQKIVPGLLLDKGIVRQPPPDPGVPGEGVGHGPGGGGWWRPGDVAIGLQRLGPGVGVALVGRVLVTGAGVLALQSPGPEKDIVKVSLTVFE